MTTTTYFDEINSLEHKQKHYFASCNTPNGFISFFNDIFAPEKFDTIYILKGGPGVGKSTLLKTIGKECEKRNFDTEYFHCSSSPTSLDGIIINDLKLAVFDGTLPHGVEPVYPGVREIIINMGECWNIEKLRLNKSEICELINTKTLFYRKATNYLAAVESIKKEIFSVVESAVNYEKLDQNIKRICARELQKCPVGEIEIRITSAYSNIGKIKFDTFQNNASNNYFLKESKGTSNIYLKKLFDIAKSKNIKMLVSYSPENPTHIDGLYFPNKSLAFTVLSQSTLKSYDKNVKSYKIINMERFLDKDLIRSKKQSIKFGEKCIKELEDESFKSFEEAGKTHEALESLYIPSTDYRRVTTLTNSLMRKIF